MKTLSKILAVLLAASALFLFAGCADDAANSDATTQAGSDTGTTAGTEAPTDAATEAPTEAPTEAHVPVADLVLASCDTIDGAAGVTLDTENKVEGEGAWLHAPGGDVIVEYKFAPVDITGYENAYLKMSVFCSDIAGVGTEGQIELSSIANDNGELTWLFGDYVLNTGWNEIYLPINTAGTSGDPFDFTQAQYIRLYSLGHTASFSVDDIRLVDETAVPQG